jgi:hypothetical protein
MTSVKKIIGWLILCAAFLLCVSAQAYAPESFVWGNFNTGYDAPVGLVGAVYDSHLDSIPAYDGATVFHTSDTRSFEAKRPFFGQNAQFLAAETTGTSLTQVSYGEGLSTWSQTLRYSTGNFNPAGNVAVFQYVDEAGETQYAMGYAQRFTGHSEKIVGNGLLDMGIQPSQVTGIYTEFSSCQRCATYLQQTFPNVPVSYSFPLNAAGKAAKAAAFSGF